MGLHHPFRQCCRRASFSMLISRVCDEIFAKAENFSQRRIVWLGLFLSSDAIINLLYFLPKRAY